MGDNLVKDKSYAFALRIINLNKYMVKTHREFVISKQVMKSGTSIGANIAEGLRGESKSDFVHKLSIALKEATETEYWLNLLRDGGYISNDSYISINEDCIELIKLLKSIIISSKKNLK